MKMMTKEVEKALPALYSQEEVSDPVCVLKYFTPWTNWTWYFTEGNKENEDWRFFGKVVSSMCPDGELGYTMLSEMTAVNGPGGLKIERDMYWTPKPLSQCT